MDNIDASSETSHTEELTKIQFDPSLGAECLPATNHRALVAVHVGSLHHPRKERVDEYNEYVKQVNQKRELYLNSGDIVIDVSMRMDWAVDQPVGPQKNVLNLISLNGHGKVTPEFHSKGVKYYQDIAEFAELLKSKGIQDIEVIGEFGKGCAAEINELFSKLKFNSQMGSETFD